MTPFQVELHKRFSLPVAALVFILVGFPLGIRTHRGGRTLALGSSLAVVAAYYVLHTFLEGVALRGHMPVVMAMWLPNAIFGVIGLLLLHGATGGLPASWSRLMWRLRAAVPRGFRRVFPRRPAVERGADPPAHTHGPRASTYIIDRYLVGQYLTFLATGTAVAAVLIVVVDLIQYLDRFLRLEALGFDVAAAPDHFCDWSNPTGPSGPSRRSSTSSSTCSTGCPARSTRACPSSCSSRRSFSS